MENYLEIGVWKIAAMQKQVQEKMIKDYIVLKKNKCRFDNLEVEV